MVAISWEPIATSQAHQTSEIARILWKNGIVFRCVNSIHCYFEIHVYVECGKMKLHFCLVRTNFAPSGSTQRTQTKGQWNADFVKSTKCPVCKPSFSSSVVSPKKDSLDSEPQSMRDSEFSSSICARHGPQTICWANYFMQTIYNIPLIYHLFDRCGTRAMDGTIAALAVAAGCAAQTPIDSHKLCNYE